MKTPADPTHTCEVRKTTDGDYLWFIDPVADRMESIRLRLDGVRPSWVWNGDLVRPTLNPSVRHMIDPKFHYTLENGKMTILEDSPTGVPKIVVDLPTLMEWEWNSIKLPMWVVTRSPSDFPGKFVVRRRLDDQPNGNWHYFADTLEEVRRVIPANKIRVVRDPKDDPVIVETWL